MSNRIPISKKLRFEVFKRDKFQCQYCGRKAPDVVLEVDHIDPVANGGDNNITNLITSCFDCNRGKKDIPLSVNQTLEKQRLQMELLQEKREQLEMMCEWRKELNDLSQYQNDLYTKYIEDKMSPFSMKENFKHTMLKTLNNYSYEEVFNAIDLSATKYLKLDDNGELLQDSANDFLNKIGGILRNEKQPPIQQNINYIKGICRNRFNFFDNRRANILLNEYVNSLKSKGWSEDKIINDLKTEVVELTKNKRNWTDWKNNIEKWIEDISKWEEDNSFEGDYVGSISISDSQYSTNNEESEDNDDDEKMDMDIFSFVWDIRAMVDYIFYTAQKLHNITLDWNMLYNSMKIIVQNWLYNINNFLDKTIYDWNDLDRIIKTHDLFGGFNLDDQMQVLSKNIITTYIEHIFKNFYNTMKEENYLTYLPDVIEQVKSRLNQDYFCKFE